MEEKFTDRMKEGFENVKEKLKEGYDKLTDMEDEAMDAAQKPGENLNEQLSDPMHDTADEKCACCIDYEGDNIIEEYEEVDIIMPDDNDNVSVNDDFEGHGEAA